MGVGWIMLVRLFRYCNIAIPVAWIDWLFPLAWVGFTFGFAFALAVAPWFLWDSVPVWDWRAFVVHQSIVRSGIEKIVIVTVTTSQ